MGRNVNESEKHKLRGVLIKEEIEIVLWGSRARRED